MLIAHLPAGYLLARASRAQGLAMAAVLAGSVLPDLDLIWFYLIDDRAFHHHRYWVHAPGFWLMGALVALPLLRAFRPGWLRPALVFLAAIFLHLVLDSLGGGIMWAWPLSTDLYRLVTVPATQPHWVASFILHWTFLAELVITAAAAALWLTRPKVTHAPDHLSR